jgi:murein DD-endopeptidase MepM/ murein hydrolase activator NlpD
MSLKGKKETRFDTSDGFVSSRSEFCRVWFFGLNRQILIFLPVLALLFFQQGCRQEKVPEPYKPSDAHDAYLHSLQEAGLSDTALGQDWIFAGEKALLDPLEITLPHEEIFYVDPSEATAVAYRFEVKRGQRIEVDVFFNGQKPCRLFIDSFRIRGESWEEWLHVASANESEKRLEYEPRMDAQYVIRLQPELLRGGQFRVTLRKVAALEFPVQGKDSRSIGSGFGAPRDGGRRKHHGVDIFARRHTPVLAPSDALVQRVRESDIGGLNLWLLDSKRQIRLYFAHLQTQDVQENMHVKTGQQIGTVGNTGNARTTPPHLHFGIYARGPVDPAPYITKVPDTPQKVSADTSLLGRWIRTRSKNVSLLNSADRNPPSSAILDLHFPMKAVAATKGMYRVLLPDGTSGYIREKNIETTEKHIGYQETHVSQPVTEVPHGNAAAKTTIEAGEILLVLGIFEGFLYIKTEDGLTGWVSVPSPSEDRLEPAFEPGTDSS